jgi:deoxycytidylate deaminase
MQAASDNVSRTPANKRLLPALDKQVTPKRAKVTPEQTHANLQKSATRDTVKTPKRSGYLSWDEYFLAIAVLSSKRSKDPESPSGACM